MDVPTLERPSAAVESASAEALAALLSAWAQQQGAHWTVKLADSGRYVAASESVGRLFGRDPASWVGRTDADLFEAPTAALLRAADQTALAQGAPLATDHRIDAEGQRKDLQALRCVHGDGPRRAIACLWRDPTEDRKRERQLRTALEQIEQQQKANEALRRELGDQGLRDAQTGLYTRAHFEDQLRREVDLSTREHREFALVYIALDPLQAAVLAGGEAAMSRILEAVGRLLRGNTRAMDTSCRLDDLRFAVLLSGVGLATAHARMEGLRRQCATQIVVLDGRELGFTVSIGIASFPHTAHSQDEVREAGEAALQQASSRGGNTIAMAGIRFEAA